MTNSLELGKDSWWPPEEAAAQEFVRYSDDSDLKTLRRNFDFVTMSSKEFVSGAESGGKFFRAISSAVCSGTPASFIRLGDADGNVLFSMLDRYPSLAEYCSQKISKIYFGNNNLMFDERRFFAEIILEALADADGIGAPEWGTIEASFSTPYPSLDVRGMCGMRAVYTYLAEKFDLNLINNACWSSTWYSRSLLPHYDRLMSGQRYVGFITCYDNLATLWKQRANIGEVETYLVPMQSSIAYQTKRSPHMGKDIGHYPETYNKIMEKIRPPYQGALFIVAAGILSKPYCTQIKRRGGVAIDVGSIADVWMNTKSRPDMGNDITKKWSIAV